MTRPASDSPLTLVPYGEDPLAALATRLVERFGETLPDLSRVTVLLPDLQPAPRLRRHLLDAVAARGRPPALLGPRVETLGGWSATRPLGAGPAVCAPHAGRLMLVEALTEHRRLFGDADPWLLSDTLGELFEELTLNAAAPPGDLDDFVARLRAGYGRSDTDLRPLSQEARLVHTLWQAWHRQLAEEDRVDPAAARVEALGAGAGAAAETYIYAVEPALPGAAERAWLDAALAAGGAELVLQGRPGPAGYHPDAAGGALLEALGIAAPEPPAADDPATAALDAVFDRDAGSLPERARDCARRFPGNPLEGRLAAYAAPDAETEAHAVELQVRRWLIDGARTVGVVTDDRRLARRVRALLERAGIVLADAGGWALSTTSAAAALERWLEAVEEDFRYEPLLDLMKSPFVARKGVERDDHLETVYRFEHDIVRNQNVARGLRRYRKAIEDRRHYHTVWRHVPETPARIQGLLSWIDEAARPLRALLHGAHAPGAWLDALEASLGALGLRAAFARDPAGERILDELTAMRAGLERRRLMLDWLGFRTWLGRTLERHYFRPGTAASAVQLMALEQSALARFDGVIVAGATAEHLPGEPADTPFFNDRVRRELGLPSWRDRLNARFHRFRQLLEAAPRVLITTRRESEGRDAVPSPWLEAIRAFHRLAYGEARDLTDHELARHVRSGHAHVREGDGAPPPGPTPYPRPAAAAELVPDTFSASAYQDLMDCPYKFHAARCLALKPSDRVREALEKSDYGGRVHACLQAFHFGAGRRAAFGRPVTEDARAEAEAHLRAIAHEVFARDLEDNFEHRGWLRRFEAAIPAIIDWEIRRAAAGWRAKETEQEHERPLASGAALAGRPDRIDVDGDARHGIVDYKTGAIPPAKNMKSGEDVQLAAYAALLDHVARVEFVDLDREAGRSKDALEGEALAELTSESLERLDALVRALRAGAPMPAWGDADTCTRCDVSGLCRLQTWTVGPREEEA